MSSMDRFIIGISFVVLWVGAASADSLDLVCKGTLWHYPNGPKSGKGEMLEEEHRQVKINPKAGKASVYVGLIGVLSGKLVSTQLDDGTPFYKIDIDIPSHLREAYGKEVSVQLNRITGEILVKYDEEVGKVDFVGECEKGDVKF